MPGRPFIQYIKSPPWPDRSRWTESEFEAVERSMSSMWPVEWRDMIGNITLRGTPGANSPTWKEITGMTGMYGYAFHPTTMNEVWINYHIDHDYYVQQSGAGSPIFLHTHWINAAAAPHTGTVRWGVHDTLARGHQQDAVPTTTTVYKTQSCNATRYRHHIAEIDAADAVTGTIEPDTLIPCRISSATPQRRGPRARDAGAARAGRPRRRDSRGRAKRSRRAVSA